MIRSIAVGLLSLVLAAAAPFVCAASLDYADYAAVLTAGVDGEGLVDYSRLKQARGRLDAFVASLGTLARSDYESWEEKGKIAFWLNAYNALTVQLIIDHYPIKSSRWKSLRFPKNSIRQIDGAWDKVVFGVMGQELTLGHIEHEMLRKEFAEPRIHMALVCAAKGCPVLRNEPYEGERLDAQLDEQALVFSADPLKVKFDHEKRRVYLSPIFKWFADDFVPAYGENKESAVISFVLKHGGETDESLAELVLNKRYAIKHLDYDWKLNERGRTSASAQ